MDKQLKLLLIAASPLIFAILFVGLSQLVNGQQIDELKEATKPVRTDITNHYFTDDKLTVIGTIHSDLPVGIVVVDITLELYDINNDLIGVSSQYPYLVVGPNDYGVWKITITNNDVADISLIENVISDATYLEQDLELDFSNYT